MSSVRFWSALSSRLFVFLAILPASGQAELAETIEKIKPLIVAVGTLKQTNSPQFVLRGTGFVVGSGSLVATNAHVVPERADPNDPVLVIQTRSINGELQLKRVQLVS